LFCAPQSPKQGCTALASAQPLQQPDGQVSLHTAIAAGVGATVLQLGGGPKQLYYYPKDTTLVVNVGPSVNKGEAGLFGYSSSCPARPAAVHIV
jgi:hypothetical protein